MSERDNPRRGAIRPEPLGAPHFFMVSKHRHNIVVLRERLHLTQAEFAKLIGRSLPAIQAIEHGKLKLSVGLALRIADVTGADKDWLLRNDLSAPMPPIPPQPKPRKIIQIAPVHANVVFALCDDGTAWVLAGGWKQLPDIPQEGDEDA